MYIYISSFINDGTPCRDIIITFHINNAFIRLIKILQTSARVYIEHG